MPRLQQLVLPTPWEVGPVQIYVVLGDPLTLIDTGVKSPASRAALEAAFDALGHGLEEVERVILTHHHGDHLGQAQSLRGAGAELEVWAHEIEAPTIEAWSAERRSRHADAHTHADGDWRTRRAGGRGGLSLAAATTGSSSMPPA